MNRKGVFAEFGEMVFVSVLYFIVIILAIIFIGVAELNVEGTIEAENARFTCKNNIATFLKYETMAGETYDELIVRSYAIKDFKDLEGNVTTLFNKLQGVNSWQLEIHDFNNKLASAGEASGSDVEGCSAYLPVPCRTDEYCKLQLKLKQAY